MKQRISGVRQMTYSPWGYHAGCHGSPVIMSRPSSASNPGSRSIEKRFGMVEKKRMLLPSPASFGLKSKPSAAINATTAPSGEASRPSSAAVSRSQTSMSNYKPWYVVKLTHFENLIFHKNHNFKISFFTKFTISKSHFFTKLTFSNIEFLIISG